MLHISYKDHVTNKEIYIEIQQPIGAHIDLLTVVNRSNMQWYCNISFLMGLPSYLVSFSEREEKTRWRKEEGGRQHQGNGET